jgi:dephospho-CoA kinase
MIIGITGGLATGVSTAASYIASYIKAGFISADKIAHAQLKRNEKLIDNLVSYFGEDILAKGRFVDRRKLAHKAFSKKSYYRKLCMIAYPVIIVAIDDKIRKLYRQGFENIVVDAPMLIESGFYKKCDCSIVVTSSLSLQVQRCQERKMQVKEVLSRIRFQMPLYKKIRHADYIIDNSGSMQELRSHCGEIARSIK